MRNFINIINSVVAEINKTRYLNFIHGEASEVIKTLQEQDKNATLKAIKYPLLILFEPFEQIESETETIDSVVTCNMAIVTASNKNDRSDKRNTDNYIAILDPLYELLIRTIRQSRGNWFQIPNYKGIPHTRQNIMFNSEQNQNQNILSSIVDAIQINNLQLSLTILSNKNY